MVVSARSLSVKSGLLSVGQFEADISYLCNDKTVHVQQFFILRGGVNVAKYGRSSTNGMHVSYLSLNFSCTYFSFISNFFFYRWNIKTW